MKRLLIISLMGIMLLGLMSTSCATETTQTTTEVQEPVVLSMAGPWPGPDPVGILCQEFVDRFNERAGGRYVIELHLSESMVTMMESFDAVRTNTVDIAGYPPGVFASVEPRFYAAEIPFLWDSAKADGAGQKRFVPMYNEFLPEKYNQRMLGCLSGTALEILSNKPIKTIEDWEGIVFQSVSPQATAIIEALGGSAVPITFTEGYQALQKGTVDASMIAPAAMIAFKMYEVVKYYTSAYICSAPSCLTINEDVFQAMPKDIQDIIVEEGEKWSDDGSAHFINSVEADLQLFHENGIETYALPAAERAKWREVLLPVRDQFLGYMGEFGDRVLAVADELNAKYPY